MSNIVEYYGEVQRTGLENVKRFSWDKGANEVKAFYEEVFADAVRCRNN